MTTKPNLSIIIPCRGEEKFIAQCLDSVIANDYPKDKLEVLVVEGMSEDGTRGILKRYAERFPFIKLLDNPKRITSAALNIGIKQATGEIIMIMSAHAVYEKDYISKCVKYLHEYNADDVGGIWKIVPREGTLVGKAIALAWSNPFAAGNAYYKIGVKGPRWVDAVAYGCFRKDVFEKVGTFDESVERRWSEDMDFNIRLRKAGGKILLVPEAVCYYYARSDFKAFSKHIFDNGFLVTYPLKHGKRLFVLRHLIPFTFISTLISSALLSILFSAFLWILLVILGSYFLTNIFFSIGIALREKEWKYLFVMPVVFATFHMSHGLGAIWGLLKVLVSKQLWKNFILGSHKTKCLRGII